MRGPTPASTVLTPAEEAAIVLFRQKTLLPLDDCLYALQETIPHLSRSALLRCLQRYGLSRLPPDEVASTAKKARFKDYALGYRHVDFAEVQPEVPTEVQPEVQTEELMLCTDCVHASQRHFSGFGKGHFQTVR